jgi:hypothetical protein
MIIKIEIEAGEESTLQERAAKALKAWLSFFHLAEPPVTYRDLRGPIYDAEGNPCGRITVEEKEGE